MSEDLFAQSEEGERLSRVLARLGYGSRRRCDEMIAQGRAKINGVVATLGARVDVTRDALEIDGQVVGAAPGLAYLLLNKPTGVITTASDPQGRPTVLDLIDLGVRVFPVGRLDANTEGLLILTNDGDFAQLLSHPSHGVEKEYLAYVKGTPNHHDLSRLRRGISLDDGMSAPAKVALLGPQLVRIAIHEGRNRQVRRMFDALGHQVLRLVRTRIGSLSDTTLAQGEYRELTKSEIIGLRRDAASS